MRWLLSRILGFVVGTSLLTLAPAAGQRELVESAEPEPIEVPPAPEQQPAGEEVGAREIYTPSDFTRFAPRTALDMLEQVPGFIIRDDDQARGLGQASGNILINGERVSSKSANARDQLGRIPTSDVVRIEIVDGASLDIPGLSGRVANIVSRSTGLSGQFEWRPQFSIGPARPRWGEGNISVSGTTGPVDFTFALENSARYQGSEGPNLVTDPFGFVDRRFSTTYSAFDNPTVTGTFVLDLPGSARANLNLIYEHGVRRERERETTASVLQPFREERLRTANDRDSYEIGADVAFAVGPGRLKLIGLESYGHERRASSSVLTRAGLTDVGSRFTRDFEEGERVGRAEYSWPLWGGDWQISGEAAFNRLDNIAGLASLDPVTDTFVTVSFPGGMGGVRESRYEGILSHGRPLSERLALQVTLGGELSQISQTGTGALARSFKRPKGSVLLAWAPADSLDVSLEVARRVGQLEFGDFLPQVNLSNNNVNAGNNRLRPQQSWELELQANKRLGALGSATLRLFDERIEDYVTIVPLAGGGESSGNIDSARRYGLAIDATIRTDPIGLAGGQFNINLEAEQSRLVDPVAFFDRRFDRSTPRSFEIKFRRDIPVTDWAYGLEFRDTVFTPYYRVSERGLDYNLATNGAIYVENKDVFGLLMQVRASNLFNTSNVLERTLFLGPRTDEVTRFSEDRRRELGYIVTFTVGGSF